MLRFALITVFIAVLFFISFTSVYSQKVALTFFGFNNQDATSRFDFYENEAEHIEKIKRIMPKNSLRLGIEFRDYIDIRENSQKFRMLKDTTIYLVGNNEQDENRFPIDFRKRSEVENELVIRPTNYAVFGRFLAHIYYKELYGETPEITTTDFLLRYETDILRLKTLENNHFALYSLLVYYSIKEQKEEAFNTLKKMQELFYDKYLLVQAVGFYEKVFAVVFFTEAEKVKQIEKYPQFYLTYFYTSYDMTPDKFPLKTALEGQKILSNSGENEFTRYSQLATLWGVYNQYDSALVHANKYLNYWENDADSLLIYTYTHPLAAYSTVAEVFLLLQRYEESFTYLHKGKYLTSESKINLEIVELNSNLEFHRITALNYKGLGKIDSAFSIYEQLIVEWGAESYFKDSLKNLYPLRFPDAKENFDDYYARIRGKKVYPNAPIVDLNLLRGNEKITIGGESTEIYVLNFWGIFCQPCIREFPLLNELTEKYASFNQIKFISITQDSPESLNKFFLKKQFKYNHAHSALEASRAYEATAIPVNLIIDKKGKIIFRHVGYDKDIVNKMSEVLDNLIVNGDY